MAHDVFISYSTEDKNVADAICSVLEKNDHRCWIASRDSKPGHGYAGQIQQAVKACKVLVLVWSEKANASKHVLAEVRLAFDSEKLIVPFRIEEVEPSSDFDYYLGTWQWLDALTPSLDQHLEKLVGNIKRLIEPSVVPAPVPEIQNSPKDEKAQENSEKEYPVKDAVAVTKHTWKQWYSWAVTAALLVLIIYAGGKILISSIFSSFVTVAESKVAFTSTVTPTRTTTPTFTPTMTQTAASGLISTNCYALDLVFLIDQSHSMGSGSGVPGSDPYELRIETARWVIDWLGDDVLNYQNGNCSKKPAHRIAVVSWGDQVEIDLPLTKISPDNYFWLVEKEALKAKISASDMGSTNPMLAFEAAKKIVDEARIFKVGDIPRKRVIIFITDGNPCVPELGCDTSTGPFWDVESYMWDLAGRISEDYPYDEDWLNREKCLENTWDKIDVWGYGSDAEIEKAIDTCLRNNEVTQQEIEMATYIWAIMLENESGYNQAAFAPFEEVVQSHAGETIYLNQNSDIPTEILSILSRLSNRKTDKIECGSLFMDPYLESAAIVFFKTAPELSVALSYEDGGIIYSLDNMSTQGFDIQEYTSDSTIDRFVIAYPDSGEWFVNASECIGIEGYMVPIGFEPKLNVPVTIPQYDLEPYYDPGNPRFITFELLNSADGRQLPEDTNYPISVAVEMDGPDGHLNPSSFMLEYLPGEKVFRSSDPIKVNADGRYYIYARATTTSANPENLQDRLLFDKGPFSFTVSEAIPFIVVVLEPQDGDRDFVHETVMDNLAVRPILIRAAVMDRNGSPIDPRLVFNDPENALTAWVETDDEIYPVALRQGWAEGEYVGELQNIEYEGRYRLLVELNGEYRDRYRPDNRSDSIAFVREDNIWRKRMTYYILVGLVVLVVSIPMLYSLLTWKLIRVRGYLIFELDSKEIATIKILKPFNHIPLVEHPELNLRSLEVRKSRTHPGTIEYVAIDFNGRRYGQELLPNRPENFIGEMRIRYQPIEGDSKK
jgi:hypothetical protein